MTKEEGLQRIIDLVVRFSEQLPAYKKTDYNETQTRRDFIDPFFKALGWDIDNKQGFAESYREVIHEDRVKVGNATKAPDYSFRLGGGKRLFFVEAKKPSVYIKDDLQPAYQVRRYGWSAKLNVSIITDFEEFAIYDCTKKPNPNDKPSTARVKYITYENYEKEWDFIWDTFSKEAVLKGSFDKFIVGTANKKGTATVDKEFLNSLDTWRTLLAETISKENKQLDEDELNFVVQQTLDRIIFLRICEDRSIEPYGNLQDGIKTGDYYQNLLKEFKQADDKYNSGLFDFKKDKLSHTLSINNKTLKTIINELYYPACPYEFSVLSVEILGSAYEQFLGKTITINDKGKAVIELKPEVRKAGGVYYTPQYIVDYIVENTIGKLTENKTPKQVEEIKIVDPACGSGSFLIGAYQYLLSWHKDYYTQNPNKKNPLTLDGNLTTSEKKKILLNNIYGVDIDTNAVEVTKLSLLLKCMEGETQASIANQMTMFKERVLPTLDENIKSGNSLIDTDYYDHQLDFGEERKIKPFSWQKAFPSVFRNGGFDVVIGNPPYLKLTATNERNEILQYYQNKFISYSGGSSKNLFQLFLEKTIHLKPTLFAFIIPEAILTSDSNGKIRDMILDNYNITSLVTFNHFVFQDATIGTIIVVGNNDKKEGTKLYKIDLSQQLEFKQDVQLSKGKIWEVEFDLESNNLCNKLINNSTSMRELVTMSKGMVVKNRDKVLTDHPLENSLPFLLGNCMGRYFYKPKKYANYNHLEIIGGTRDYKKQTIIPRLLIRRTGGILCATYSNQIELVESTIYILRSENINLMYLLGLINSKLFTYFLIKKLLTNQQGFPQVLMGQLEQLPIKTNDSSTKINTNTHDIIVVHVEQLLQLNQDLQTTTLETHKQQIKSKIEYHEDKINHLVYQLYNLTEDEIKIVENY